MLSSSLLRVFLVDYGVPLAAYLRAQVLRYIYPNSPTLLGSGR